MFFRSTTAGSGRRMQFGFRGHASKRSVSHIRASHSTHCISGSYWTPPPKRKSWRAVTHPSRFLPPSFPTRHTLAERTERRSRLVSPCTATAYVVTVPAAQAPATNFGMERRV